MTLVFLALGLIVLAMVSMGRLLRPKPRTEDEASELTPERQQRARVAAMAAAIFIAHHRAELPDGGAWHTAPSQAGAPSPWLASHRAQALTRRPLITKGKG
jgi:Na+-transporting methylmalonyl-CoA/oxaloacetate decarboxylase gamma subunit